MRKRAEVINTLITIGVFILLETLATFLLVKNTVFQQSFIMSGIRSMQYSTWENRRSLGDYMRLKQQNKELAAENIELKNMVELLRTLQNDTQCKEECDSTINSLPHSSLYYYIAAEVINNTITKKHNYIYLNKGSEDGVDEGMGVICPSGIVGIIIGVTQTRSIAISVLNIRQKTSLRLKRTNAVGIASWEGFSPRRIVISDILKQVDVQKGDTVVTSGFSSIFPPDIPVGVVADLSSFKGVYYKLGIDIFANFEQLRYVTIVHVKGKKELEALQDKEIQ